MRVLHVISGIDPQNGGPTEALLGLSTAQARLGADVTVLATWYHATGPANAAAFEAGGVRVRLVGPCSLPLMRHPDLRDTMREEVARAEVVHVHALFEQAQHEAAVACRRLGVPYVMRPCGGLDPWALAQSKWKKRLYLAWRLRRDLNGARLIHYMTDAECDASAAVGLRSPSVVVPNGIDVAEFSRPPGGSTFLCDRLPQIGGRRVALFLARIDPKKGLDVLLPAWAAARPDDAALVLAGPDSRGHRATVEAEVDRLGLRESVLFAGMLDRRERTAALHAADLFVLTSHVENFGITVIEAAAAGVPLLISDRVNVAPLVADAGAGVVVPLDVAATAAALRDWPAADAGRSRTFAARFDWSGIARNWLDLYARSR